MKVLNTSIEDNTKIFSSLIFKFKTAYKNSNSKLPKVAIEIIKVFVFDIIQMTIFITDVLSKLGVKYLFRLFHV